MFDMILRGVNESILVRITPKIRKFMQVRWYEQEVPIFRIRGSESQQIWILSRASKRLTCSSYKVVT
jgi:hypothetical protein